jgi:hypothetical protein
MCGTVSRLPIGLDRCVWFSWRTVKNAEQLPKRYHLNVVGDFYVEDGCCTWCGVPGSAPDLFETDHERHEQCFVKKQPTTPGEIEAMVAVVEGQELGCIRYAGRDRKILRLLSGKYDRDQCDEMVRDPVFRREVLDAIELTPVERVCRLARDQDDTGASTYQLLRASGIAATPSALTPEAVLAMLREDPILVRYWLRYSEDKRTSGGLYFLHDDDGRYTVGSVGGERFHFDDALIACATFIVGEMRPQIPAPWWRRLFGG